MTSAQIKKKSSQRDLFKNQLIYFNWKIVTLHIVRFLPYIDVNQPRVHESHSREHRLSPPPTPSFCVAQSTGFECPASYTELALAIYFTYGNIHVSMLISNHPTQSPKICSLHLFSFAALHIGLSILSF